MEEYKARAPTLAEGNGSPADDRDQRRQRGSTRPLRYRWGKYVAGLGNLLSPAAHHLADHLVLHWMQDDGSVGKVLPDGHVKSPSIQTLGEGMGYDTPSQPKRAVRELREHGLLESTRTGVGPGHPNLYQAVLPEAAGQDRTPTYHHLPAETETAGQDRTPTYGTAHAEVQRNSAKAKDEALVEYDTKPKDEALEPKDEALEPKDTDDVDFLTSGSVENETSGQPSPGKRDPQHLCQKCGLDLVRRDDGWWLCKSCGWWEEWSDELEVEAS